MKTIKKPLPRVALVTSPAGAGEVETRSVEGEGDRVASLYLLRADPITLTFGADAPRVVRFAAQPREAGEVSDHALVG